MTPKQAPAKPSVVVFDLGGVVVDWNPRHLLDRLIVDTARRERFLADVLTVPFFMALDIARDSRAAIRPAIDRHPEFTPEIEAYVDRFAETVAGEFPEMAALVQRLHDAGTGVYGLTNWAADTFDQTRLRLPSLGLLRDIIVSGHEGIIKPDPQIFALVCKRGGFAPADAVFIDDSLRNVEGAQAFGMAGIHHRSAVETIAQLKALGLPA